MSHAHTPPLLFDNTAEFDQWAAKEPGTWELHDGVAIAMAPERADHVRIKASLWLELRNALRANATACEALMDGIGVLGHGVRSFRPDVLVNCGAPLAADAQFADAPLILAEVISPSTEGFDTGLKLESYFELPSLRHYLVVSSSVRRVIHYSRASDGRLLTTVHPWGTIRLDPPGIEFALDAIYDGTAAPPRQPPPA